MAAIINPQDQFTTSVKAEPVVNYLFMGNPGTGKSTLINCLVGDAIFASGISYGGGLTKSFQQRRHDTVQYMDTPGLADRQIQESAAAAITKALKQGGDYKLFFTVRLENGRVMSDDLATIEIVLNSIGLDDIPFTVIVNNVKARQYAKMMEKEQDFLKVLGVINSIKHPTLNVVFIPVQSKLDEEDNAVIDLPGDVEEFIHWEAPTVNIPPSVVNPIKIDDFKKVSEALRNMQEQLLQDNAALERRLAELVGRSKGLKTKLIEWLESFVSSMHQHGGAKSRPTQASREAVPAEDLTSQYGGAVHAQSGSLQQPLRQSGTTNSLHQTSPNNGDKRTATASVGGSVHDSFGADGATRESYGNTRQTNHRENTQYSSTSSTPSTTSVAERIKQRNQHIAERVEAKHDDKGPNLAHDLAHRGESDSNPTKVP